MVDTVTESQVIPLLAEWDVDPEVSSQVYQRILSITTLHLLRERLY